MNTVIIPEGYFFNLTKKEYFDYKSRLWQELIANSVDAKATKIEIEITDNSFCCKDNGNGMDKEKIINGLLTFGGSIKDKNSIGMFGHGKICVLFSHSSFFVHTLNTKISGKEINYEMENTDDFYQGTIVKCQFCSNWGHNKNEAIEIIKHFLKKCNLSCNVFINGELFNEYTIYELGRKMEWADLYVGKENKYSNYISIRHNGLFMFDSYVNGLNKEVILEVKGQSIDVFSQNRDSFTGKCRDQFSALVNEINTDKRSFTKPNLLRKIYIRGKNGLISIFGKKEIKQEVNFSDEVVMTYLAGKKIENGNSFLTTKDINVLSNNDFENDFIFDLTNSDFEYIPEEFAPETMLRRYKFLAALWKHCLIDIMKVNNIYGDFVIGFAFSKEIDAVYFRDIDELRGFLINPTVERFLKGDLKERFYHIFSAAIHEIVHFEGHQYHDEEFAVLLTKKTGETLTKFSGCREICERARKELN